MKSARALLVEDCYVQRYLVNLQLENNRHEIVGEATTSDEALLWLSRIATQQEDVNVIILDGNLSNDSFEGADAKKIVAESNHLQLPLHIIGFSVDPMDLTPANGIFVDLKKFNVDSLAKTLSDLPELAV